MLLIVKYEFLYRLKYKILLIGLDNAGKTSIYRSALLGEQLDTLQNLKPTRGIERYTHIFGDQQVIFWDLGGQKQYRKNHLASRNVFLQTHALIYVIDVQDDKRFQESLDYFHDILDIVKDLNPLPKVFVLYHKMDQNKINILRSNLLKANSLIGAENQYNIKTINLSTSAGSTSTLNALGVILMDIIPGFDDLGEEYKTNAKVYLTNEHKTPLKRAKEQEDKALDDLVEKMITNEKLSKLLVDKVADSLQDEVHKLVKMFFQQQKKEDEDFKITVAQRNIFANQLVEKFTNKMKQPILELDGDNLEMAINQILETDRDSEPDELEKDTGKEGKLDYNRFDTAYSRFKEEIQVISDVESLSIEEKRKNILVPFLEGVQKFMFTIIKNGYNEKLLGWEEQKILKEFVQNFSSLKSELLRFIESKNIKEFEIERKLPIILKSLLDNLVQAAQINEIIKTEDQKILKSSITKLFTNKIIR